MKPLARTVLIAGLAVLAGCASLPAYPAPRTVLPQTFTRNLAGMKVGETTEAQVLEYFGNPEIMDTDNLGRRRLIFMPRRQGLLYVSFRPDGRVGDFLYVPHGGECRTC